MQRIIAPEQLRLLSDEDLITVAIDSRLEAEAIEEEASPSRWREADVYAELADRGWIQQRIAEACGSSQSSVSKFIACARHYSVLNNRPAFWRAFAEVNSEKRGPDENDSHHLDVHFSSAKSEWETPQDLFDQLNAEFNCTLDVCATARNTKCDRFFTAEIDGLTQDWTGACWMNPPYGEAIADWIAKAHAAAQAGATVVCLVPARTDTKWWWDHVRFGEIRFLQGRLQFGGAKSSAPFPSCVVIFKPEIEASVKWWER